MNRKEEIQESASQLRMMIQQWEPRLRDLPLGVISDRRNSQNRTIRQIVGHLVDSAANNHHRIVRLQYVKRLMFPDYQPDNDTWIAVQHYQEKDWNELIDLWKCYNLHLAWIIETVDERCLDNEWTDGFIQPKTLFDIMIGYNSHFQLHLSEIEQLQEHCAVV